MSKDKTVKLKGNVGRVLSEDYLEGRVMNTQFEMDWLYDERRGHTSEKEIIDFPGPLPEEYVGHCVEYTKRVIFGGSYTSTHTLELITISSDGEIDRDPKVNPRTPKKISAHVPY